MRRSFVSRVLLLGAAFRVFSDIGFLISARIMLWNLNLDLGKRRWKLCCVAPRQQKRQSQLGAELPEAF